MKYQTFEPHPDLQSLIKCHWILEIPADVDAERQRIIPDGCIELIFMLGDDVKRFTKGDEFIIQPRAMVIGQITEPFVIQPTGFVNSFATRFYPYGFANFSSAPCINLANKETPIEFLFGEEASKGLKEQIVHAEDTNTRIKVVERFLLTKLQNQTTIDSIVKNTIDAIFSTGGSAPINSIVKNDASKRRQLERKFVKQIGLSPKQLGRVIRMQAALHLLLNRQSESFTSIAYESDYYDQAHFTKDFKDFTGITPKDFLRDNTMILSSLFYSKK
jgi:Helix-turn-helix domain